jgi:hypothetical protein
MIRVNQRMIGDFGNFMMRMTAVITAKIIANVKEMIVNGIV